MNRSVVDPVKQALLKRFNGTPPNVKRSFLQSSYEQVEGISKITPNSEAINLKRQLTGHKAFYKPSVLRISLEGNQDFWAKIPGLSLLETRQDYLEFRLNSHVDPNQVLATAMEAGQVTRFELVEPSLDQIFVEKVGEGA